MENTSNKNSKKAMGKKLMEIMEGGIRKERESCEESMKKQEHFMERNTDTTRRKEEKKREHKKRQKKSRKRLNKKRQ